MSYIAIVRQDKTYIAIYRMYSGGSDQNMNILVYIPTHHSELEKKNKKRSVKVVTTILISTYCRTPYRSDPEEAKLFLLI